MIFGNKNEFAIEMIIKNIPKDKNLYGYVHVYIKNKRVGHYRFFDMLCDSMLEFEGIYNMSSRRVYEELFNLDKNNLFNVIWFSHLLKAPEHLVPMIERFFPRTDDIYIYDDRVPMDFSILPDSETFGAWNGFLVSSGECDKIVYGYKPKIINYNREKDKFYLKNNFFYHINILVLPVGVVDSTIKEAVDYFYFQYERWQEHCLS